MDQPIVEIDNHYNVLNTITLVFGNTISFIYLLLCIFMSITAYTGSHRGPFGKHPHIIRFGFIPGIIGSELCLHLVLFMGLISLIMWKIGMMTYMMMRMGLVVMVPSSFYLLKTYKDGFVANKVNQRVLDTFCGASVKEQMAKETVMPKKEYQPSNKLSSVIHSIRSVQQEAFSMIESFIMQFRKQKREVSQSSHLPTPNSMSLSFWLKMLVPVPHPHFPNVQRIRHIPYGEDMYQKVDVYFHTNFPTARPILIYIHGGGWREGGGKRHTCGMPLIYQMANQKWVVFSVGYRLSPNNRFPTHIKDVKKAITWVRENAVHYGGDIDSMFIAGGSAGGHLATLATLTDGLDFEEFQSTIPKPNDDSTSSTTKDDNNINCINMNSMKLESNQDDDGNHRRTTQKKVYPPFRGCLSMYAVYDFTNRTNDWPFDLVTYLGQMIMRNTFDVEPHLYSMGSPIDQIRDTLTTPFFIIHGDQDELVPIEESYNFIRKLKEVAPKVQVTWMEVPGGHHAFDLIYSPRTIYTVHGIYRFFNRLYRQHVSEKVLARRQFKQRTLLKSSSSLNSSPSNQSLTTTNTSTTPPPLSPPLLSNSLSNLIMLPPSIPIMN